MDRISSPLIVVVLLGWCTTTLAEPIGIYGGKAGWPSAFPTPNPGIVDGTGSSSVHAEGTVKRTGFGGGYTAKYVGDGSLVSTGGLPAPTMELSTTLKARGSIFAGPARGLVRLFDTYYISAPTGGTATFSFVLTGSANLTTTLLLNKSKVFIRTSFGNATRGLGGFTSSGGVVFQNTITFGFAPGTAASPFNWFQEIETEQWAPGAVDLSSVLNWELPPGAFFTTASGLRSSDPTTGGPSDPTTGGPDAAPEPGTMLLLLGATAVVGGTRRLRRRRHA